MNEVEPKKWKQTMAQFWYKVFLYFGLIGLVGSFTDILLGNLLGRELVFLGSIYVFMQIVFGTELAKMVAIPVAALWQASSIWPIWLIIAYNIYQRITPKKPGKLEKILWGWWK